MVDRVDASTRSRMMSGIRGANTKPELAIRSHLHRSGFRFRLHARYLPGKPDLVLPKYRAIIFVNGCFWHGHGCPSFRWPKTRPDFWHTKISRNKLNDSVNKDLLLSSGWRVCVVWECAVRGSSKDLIGLTRNIGKWLKSNEKYVEVSE